MPSSLAGALRAAREQLAHPMAQVRVQAGLGLGTAGITLGGRDGSIVVSSSHSVVQKGWNLIAVDGRQLAQPVDGVLDAAKKKGRVYVVEFSAIVERETRLSQVTAAAREAQRLRRETDERMRVVAEAAKRDVAIQERREQEAAARERAAQQARRQAAADKEAQRAREEREASATVAKARKEVEAAEEAEKVRVAAAARRHAEAAAEVEAAEAAEASRKAALKRTEERQAEERRLAAAAEATKEAAKEAAKGAAKEAAVAAAKEVELKARRAATSRKALQAQLTKRPRGFLHLPSRTQVEEPQQQLLHALAAPAAAESTPVDECGPCDRCDGPHPTSACPHFRGKRDTHRDAWEAYGKDGKRNTDSRDDADSRAGQAIVSGKVVRQPGALQPAVPPGASPRPQGRPCRARHRADHDPCLCLILQVTAPACSTRSATACTHRATRRR